MRKKQIEDNFKGKKKVFDLPTISIPSQLHQMMKEAISLCSSPPFFKLKMTDWRRLAYEFFASAIIKGEVSELNIPLLLKLNLEKQGKKKQS